MAQYRSARLPVAGGAAEQEDVDERGQAQGDHRELKVERARRPTAQRRPLQDHFWQETYILVYSHYVSVGSLLGGGVQWR